MAKVKVVIEFDIDADEELSPSDAKEIVESALEHEEVYYDYTVIAEQGE